jgi:hypothetical protein
VATARRRARKTPPALTVPELGARTAAIAAIIGVAAYVGWIATVDLGVWGDVVGIACWLAVIWFVLSLVAIALRAIRR